MKVIRDRSGSVAVDDFLGRPLFAHLATGSEAGPRVSPVWFLWEDGALWIIGSRTSDTFPERVAREPRCAIAVIDFDHETGLVQHVGLRGRASLEPFDVERARRLLARYLGADERQWDARFRSSLISSDNLLVRFVPESVVARDQSYQHIGAVPRSEPQR